MDVSGALKSRRTRQAFKPGLLDRDLLATILGPALHVPSWAIPSPWEIFVASGEPLEQIRKGYAENLKNCVPRSPDVTMPKEWPDACHIRMETLQGERAEVLANACPDPSAVPDLMQMNYTFFGAPIILYLCMDRCLTPWSLFDLGVLNQSIVLSAREQGIDSAVAVTLAAYPERISKELGIPGNLAIVIGFALGHADSDSQQNKFQSSRRELAEVVRFAGFN